MYNGSVSKSGCMKSADNLKAGWQNCHILIILVGLAVFWGAHRKL